MAMSFSVCVRIGRMRGVNGAWRILSRFFGRFIGRAAKERASIGKFVVYALAAPLVGLAFDRFGPRVLMPLGAFLVGGGLVLSSFANSLFGFYFSYGLITALGQGALSFVGHNALISFWFVRKRATAIGIASMGQGLGALIMVPMTQLLINNFGWRWTFVVTVVCCWRPGSRQCAASAA